MQRRIAKLLLFVALAGNLAPLALAAAYSPAHACCLRKGSHHCPEAGQNDSSQPIVRDASCCNGCCRAVINAKWAHSQPKPAVFFLEIVKLRRAGSQPEAPATVSVDLQSTRAPPAC
jgi:hypothetical protein